MAKEPKMVYQCSWCFAIRHGKEWIPHPVRVRGSHGMCPPCEKKFYADNNLGEPTKRNPDPLLGAIIVDIRPATAADKSAIGWRANYMVIELSSGAILFASSDLEFNDAGVLNYVDARDGQVRTLVPPGRKRV